MWMYCSREMLCCKVCKVSLSVGMIKKISNIDVLPPVFFPKKLSQPIHFKAGS